MRITVPITLLTIAKIAATSSRVSTSCSVSPGANGVTVTWSAGMRVTTQIANALTTTRTMKRMVRQVWHGALRARGILPRAAAPAWRPALVHSRR